MIRCPHCQGQVISAGYTLDDEPHCLQCGRGAVPPHQVVHPPRTCRVCGREQPATAFRIVGVSPRRDCRECEGARLRTYNWKKYWRQKGEKVG